MPALVLWLLLPVMLPAAQGGHGDLLVVVRDTAGRPLPGVELALIHDADGGRVKLGTARTDAAGSIVYHDLPWGLYVVQFRGSTPAGQPIQPTAQQNAGLLDDGGGAANGFGVRLAESARTELFVLATDVAQPYAVPMFDLAPGVDAPPQPMDPARAAAPAPAMQPAREVTTTDRNPARAGSVALLLVGALVLALALLGWWRSRRATREARR